MILTGCLLFPTAVSALQVGEPSAQSKEYAEPLEAGKDLLQAGEAKKAIKQLRKASKAAGGEAADVFLELAKAYQLLEDPEKMEEAARKALALTEDAPLRFRAYDLLGLALVDKQGRTQEDLREAEQAFRKVIESAGGRAARPLFSLSVVLFELGESTEAVAVARAFLEEEPEGQISDQARVLLCRAPLSARLTDKNRCA